jgi:hypothetical protein
MNIMRSNAIFSSTVILFMLTFINVNAQTDSSGVYTTASDFRNKVLSYAVNCKSDKHALHINDFSDKATLNFVHNGQKVKISKDKIYGVKLCSGVTYRIVNKVDYAVLNPEDNLLIYKLERASTPKNPIPLKYFFSVDATGALQALTKLNLKNAFPTNHKFHDELERDFKDDNSLTEYDTYHKQYKLVRLFKNL